jgi:hypothetical protein
MAIALLAASHCLAYDTVTVCLTRSHDDDRVRAAEATASAIFRKAEIQIDWRDCRKAADGTIAIALLEHTPADADPGAMARAFVFDRVRIEIFEPRVSRSDDGIDHVLLAHVMAHEIAHILQGVPHHSETGVMKARWTRDDYARMHCRPLEFAPEDIERLRLGLAARRYCQTH